MIMLLIKEDDCNNNTRQTLEGPPTVCDVNYEQIYEHRKSYSAGSKSHISCHISNQQFIHTYNPMYKERQESQTELLLTLAGFITIPSTIILEVEGKAS